ncbi:MAG: O-acetylhomoserine aminocarboxypropyltransferase/cysteine synthase [Clostridiales bacterium]|jgi:O-acetylhomoserine (thiol)-lyase|nr:O-acetylhomoserine aminocarboxypropyltransferase/cysteine synthase [Clostridiales bacterium]
MSDRKYRLETLQVHAGQESPDPATDARAVPIYATTSYVFPNTDSAAARFALTEPGNIYTRIMNPTNDIFERRIAALEGGVGALALASGAAATAYAVQTIARSGDHIVAAQTLYGGTYNLFAHTFADFGIETTFVDPDNIDGYVKAIKPNTKAVYIESLGNPNSSIIDIEKLAEAVHAHGIPLIVDNTFATPVLLRPLELGADIVVHSATKFIGGHGTSIGGVIVDGGRFDWTANDKFPGLSQPNPSYHGVKLTDAAGSAAYITAARVILLRDTGAALSPFNAFMFLQGLETLSLRIERHVENTKEVLDFLSYHPQVERVNHPSMRDSGYKALYDKYFPNGAAPIFTFEIKGGAKEARAYIDRLKIFSLLANVADVKSLVIHPASTTHSQMNERELLEAGIKPNTIRLSIGIEHIDDIIWDLEQAFD